MMNNNAVNDQADDYKGENKVERITEYAKKHAQFGVDASEAPYAILKGSASNPVAHPLNGKKFKRWMQFSAYQHLDTLREDDVREAVELLSAHALFEGSELEVHLRNAPMGKNAVELDCADEHNTRIRLENGSVRVVTSNSKALFRQPSSMKALPIPADKGDIDALLDFLNTDEYSQFLLIGWLSYVLVNPKALGVGYPLLILKGEQGSGKSTLCKVIRTLIDPNATDIQLFPKTPTDLVISSQHSNLLIYDNVRMLSKHWSDVLCIAATKGSMSSRKLYTDDEEKILHLHTPIVLNGIHGFIQEPDLASRCLSIQLQPMEAGLRKNDQALSSEFNKQLPVIFKALLEVAAKALDVLDRVEVTHPERMLDFVRWLAAIETVCDFEAGELQNAYGKSVRRTMLETIEENHLAYALMRFAKRHADDSWTGTPQELLKALDKYAAPTIKNNSSKWPQNAIALSRRLSPLEKALRAQGVRLTLGERGKQRRITVGFDSQSVD